MTIEFNDRIIDEYGSVILKDAGLMELLYRGIEITDYPKAPSDDLNLYNKYVDKFKVGPQMSAYVEPTDPPQVYHSKRQENWLIPKQYMDIDLIEWFAAKELSDKEKVRVSEELGMFLERGLGNLLKTLIYLVDVMRENKVVWGVGRGSSVASYCLYVIGVHKIDSIKYDLDIKEFLK